MRELLVVLVVIAVIAIIWYLRNESAKTAEQRKADEFRRLQAAASEADRASLTAAASAPAAPTRAAGPGLAERGAGLFQEAADSATGRQYEKAADQMEEMTADLAAARRDAERAAEQLASRAAEALASIQAAAAAHGGAVPGDGTHDCPSDYPIKGNMPSMRYHTPGQPSYNRTIPEVCFQNGEAAEAAGFTESGDEAGMRGGAVAVEEVAVEEVVPIAEVPGRLEEVVAEAIEIRDREDGERVDIVAEAIAASDAGSVPPGAIRGDGSRDCPPAYPIKGNQSTMIYHEPGTPTYLSTIPELCFSSGDAARAAGYAPTRH
jgi:hypothetical protein